MDDPSPAGPMPALTPEQQSNLIELIDSYTAGKRAWRWLCRLGGLALAVVGFAYYVSGIRADWHAGSK